MPHLCQVTRYCIASEHFTAHCAVWGFSNLPVNPRVSTNVQRQVSCRGLMFSFLMHLDRNAFIPFTFHHKIQFLMFLFDNVLSWRQSKEQLLIVWCVARIWNNTHFLMLQLHSALYAYCLYLLWHNGHKVYERDERAGETLCRRLRCRFLVKGCRMLPHLLQLWWSVVMKRCCVMRYYLHTVTNSLVRPGSEYGGTDVALKRFLQ